MAAKKDNGEGIQCFICKRSFKNPHGLANHVAKTHSISFQEYKRRLLKIAEEEFDNLRQFAGFDYPPSKCRNIIRLLQLNRLDYLKK